MGKRVDVLKKIGVSLRETIFGKDVLTEVIEEGLSYDMPEKSERVIDFEKNFEYKKGGQSGKKDGQNKEIVYTYPKSEETIQRRKNTGMALSRDGDKDSMER